MNTETNKEEDQGQSPLDTLLELVNGLELKVAIGSKPEAGAVHLVIPRTLALQMQTVNVAHLLGSGRCNE